MTLITVLLASRFVTERLERQKNNYSDQLSARNHELNRSVQEKLDADRAQRTEALEKIKHELQDTLASRARRAEYLKSQLTNLYGPLVFWLEHCRICIQRSVNLKDLILEVTDAKAPPIPEAEENPFKPMDLVDIFGRYVKTASDDSEEAINLLRSGWNWLDAEDRPLTITFIQEIEHYKIEFKERDHTKLPGVIYSQKFLFSNALTPPKLYHEDFIRHMTHKLNLKQQELSGLIAEAERVAPPQPAQGEIIKQAS